MTAQFPITEAQIVALFLETLFYGIYLVSLGYCLRALLLRKDRLSLKPHREVNWGMLVVASLMAVFATLDVAFGLKHNLDAFVFYSGPGGASAEFSHVSYWVNVMKSVDYIAQTAIGDAILIYRLYIVYEKAWKMVIVPSFLWAATLASGCALISVEISTKHNALLDDTHLSKWNDCVCVFTLVLNVIVTSLIIWRLWKVRHDVLSITTTVGPDRLKKVIRIILDSGFIYTFMVIIFFGTALARSDAQYGVSDVVVQVIGITFNLIIIRVHDARGPSQDLIQSTFSTPSPRDYSRHPAPSFPPIPTIASIGEDTMTGISRSPTSDKYNIESKVVEVV